MDSFVEFNDKYWLSLLSFLSLLSLFVVTYQSHSQSFWLRATRATSKNSDTAPRNSVLWRYYIAPMHRDAIEREAPIHL